MLEYKNLLYFDEVTSLVKGNELYSLTSAGKLPDGVYGNYICDSYCKLNNDCAENYSICEMLSYSTNAPNFSDESVYCMQYFGYYCGSLYKLRYMNKLIQMRVNISSHNFNK